MMFKLAIFCVFIALASAGRLPLPEALQEKYHFLMKDDDIDLSRVVGGENAKDGERPWQIALLRGTSFTCGGSWITSRTVLCAAHCIDGSENNPTAFNIRYGTLGTSSTSGTTVGVQRIVKHASYSSSRIDYDYAILIVANAFTPGTNAAIIVLCTSVPTDGAEALVVSGFGRIAGGGSLATALKVASLTHMTQTTCNSRWGATNTITDRMVCAWHTANSACNGDSGGPLTRYTGTGNVCLVGVVSWGSSSCLHQTYPNVYASVPAVLEWINSNKVD